MESKKMEGNAAGGDASGMPRPGGEDTGATSRVVSSPPDQQQQQLQNQNQTQNRHVPTAAANSTSNSSMTSSSSTSAIASATDSGSGVRNGSANSGSSAQQPQQQPQSHSHLQVGRMVNVLPRTWPGINKQGGTGRITAVHRTSSSATTSNAAHVQAVVTHVDVRYVVVGGRERRVPVEYVVAAPEYEQEYDDDADGNGNGNGGNGGNIIGLPTTTTISNEGSMGGSGGRDAATTFSDATSAAASTGHGMSAQSTPAQSIMAAGGLPNRNRRRRHALRDRSMLLGRCGRCGSLRSDCGSCDWVALELEQQREQQRREQELVEQQRRQQDSDKRDMSSSKNEKKKRRGRNYDRRRKPRTSVGGGDDDGSSSDFSVDDNTPLSEIKARRERVYAKLLRETGWGNNNGGGGDTFAKRRRRHRHRDRRDNEKKKVDGDGTKPQPIKRRRIIADDEDSSSSSDEDGQHITPNAPKRSTSGRSSSSDESSSSSSSSSSSDDMNDPILARLAQLRSVRNRGRGRDMSPSGSMSTSGKMARKRFMDRYTASRRTTTPKSKRNARAKSSLEALPSPAGRTTSVATSTAPKPVATDIVDMTIEAGAEQTSLPKSPENNQQQPYARTGYVDDDDNIGEVEMTQGDFVLSGDDEEDENDEPSVAMDIESGDPDEDDEQYSDRDDNYSGARAAAIEDDDPLRLDSTFIQPEGQQAAQSLPEDTVDRTKGIEYLSLPTFFDNTAEKIENETLPDARIQVEELGVAIRKAAKRNAGPTDEAKSPAELENDALLLFNELRRTLIRDGTDQCRAALRRLTDGKERKRAKSRAKGKGASSDEYRRFKRLNKGMDLRELRMDSLDESVEEVLRKCHGLLDGFIAKEANTGRLNPASGYLEGASESSDEAEDEGCNSPQYNGQVDEEAGVDVGDAADLGEFDPHLHATLKRKKNKTRPRQRISATDESKPKRKRSQSQSRDRAGGGSSAGEGEIESRSAKVGKKRRTKPNKPHSLGSGDAQRIIGNIEVDDDFINNGISDEETMPMEARPFDRDLDSGLSRRSRARADPNNAASNGELRVSFLDDDGGFDSGNRARETEATKSASERMQEFLDKNSADAPLVDATISSSQSRGQRRRQISAHSSEGHGEFNNRNRRSERDPSGDDRNDVFPILSEALSAETLFDGLVDLERQPPASAATPRGAPAARENIPPTSSNIQGPSISSDLCDHLASTYQTSPRTAIHLLVRLERSCAEAQSDITSKTLDSLFKVVQQEGATSLIDVIINASSDQAKQLHLKLLTTVMNFTAAKSSHDQESASSSKLRGVVPRHKFAEEILLQIVDLLYAYFAPAAWANCVQGKISSTTLSALKELAESIGKSVPLVESVSRIFVSCQQVQKWYRSSLSSSNEGERVFVHVSSIDPVEYANFLKTGERRKIEQSDLRFARFKMAIPRSEVHALWMIIAFFGNVQSIPAPSSQWYRYKHIVRRLFYSDASVLSSGALLAQSQKVPLPPSKSHLSACEIELLRLSALIRSGALDPLPDQDGILTSLIQKSLSLQADSYRHDANTAANDMMVATALSEVGTKVLIREIWESSDVASPATPLRDIESKLLLQVCSEGNLSIEGGGGILRACIALMMAWMGRLPRDKKARWIRLRKDIDKLVAALSERADAFSSSKDTQDSSADGVESAFEAAFGGGGIGASRNLQAGPVASATFYRQSAAVLLLTSTLSTLKTMHQPNESVQVFDEAFLKRIWTITSNDDMRTHQTYVQNGRRGHEPAVSSDFLWSIAATKVMSIFALLYLGADNSSDSTSRTETGEDGLEFVLSCIVSSLESLCRIFMNEVKRNAEVMLFPTAESSSGVSYRPASTMCIAAISGGFTALSTILSRARTNLTNSFFSNSSRSVLMGKNVLSMIIPVTEIAFACIIQTKEADSSSDIYLRTVLATMKHSIGLFHGARKRSDTATAVATAAPSTDDTDFPPPNPANDADDIFGGLGDDAFMNIDLENLRGQSSSTPSSQMETSDTVLGEDDAEVDELAKGKLWSLLMDALDAAKPSQRYAIDSSMPPNQYSSAPSTRGKALIATNAGAICASIAALTSLRNVGSVPFKSSFEDFFQGRRSAHHATDHQSRMGDLSYLKNLGQCFTLELCRHSRVSPVCRGVVSSGLEMILGHFLEALVDPQTIHRLPSSNKAIISNSGGPKAQEMEIKYLKRMLRRSPSSSQEVDEAIGARLLDNEGFDTPGPAFMASRIWSFGRALGSIIVDLQPEDREILIVGRVLSRADSDLADEAAESCQRSLALVPLISMERECMKRIAMLRGIVSALLSDDHIVGRIATNVLSLVTKSVLQNIYYLSATVEYNERRTGDWKDNLHADPEDLYERSRALALQHAYCEVASSYFAWLLHQGARGNNLHRIDSTVVVLKDVLLRTSLQKSSNTYCAALEAYNCKSRPPYVFDVLTSRGGSSSSVSSRLADDLADGLGRRYHELVLYAADLFDLSGTTDVLSMLIESAAAVQPGGANKKDKAMLLGLALSGNHNEPIGSAIGRDDLQRATDSYFTSVHTFQASSVRERQLLGKLRRAALRNFIVPKLRFDAIEMEKKSNLLQILLSLVTANTDTSSIVICPDEEGSGHLDVSDLCLMFRGLIHVLRECLAHSTDLSQDMVSSIFQAAKLLIRLPMSNVTDGNNSEPLLAWCDATLEPTGGTTSPKTYISESFRWLNDIARLLARDACYQVITGIAVEARRTKDGHQSWDIDSLTDLDPPVECRGDDLAAIKSMLQLAQNLDTLDIDMYPDDRFQTPGQVAVKNIYAKRPAAFTTMDEKAETSSAAVLGPRCKRAIKEYISEYLSLI